MNANLDWAIAVPAALVFLVFTNRYIFGLFLRLAAGGNAREIHNDEQPTVCVIIPMYNEGETIARTLQSISMQDYRPDRLSVIVVDDCSGDDSFEWATRAATLDSRITVMKNPENMGKRLGIARAVRLTTAKIIVSVDSDVVLDAQAVRHLVRRFTDERVAAVGGRVLVLNSNRNWLTRMQTIKYFFGYEYLKNIERTFDSVMCLSGCLTAYRRDVLIALEPVLERRSLFGVPIKYGEDRFLTRQIVKSGYQTKLDLGAICYTMAPTTIDGYFAQQLRWRRSNLVDLIGGVSHVWRLHPLVAVHYLALNAMLLCYPLALWMAFVNGTFWAAASMHFGVLAIYSALYGWQTRKLDPRWRVAPVHFLWMGVVMPVTYMVLSIVALFTLDSGSWETRKVSSSAPAVTPTLA